MKMDRWIKVPMIRRGPWRVTRQGYGANKKLEKASRAIAKAQGQIWEVLNGMEREIPDTIHETDMYDVLIKEIHMSNQEDSRVQVSFQLFGSDWSTIEQSDAWKEIGNLLKEQGIARIRKQPPTKEGKSATEYFESPN